MPPTTTIRRATTADIDDLVRLRMAMHEELAHAEANRHGIARVPESLIPQTQDFLARTLPSGEFISFVAEADGRIVASSGMVMYTVPPLMVNPNGREAVIMNMYTEPDWRGQGIAGKLVEALMAEARTEGCGRIWLRASDAGRPVYERFGFEPRDYYMQILGGER